ncbi:MAG: A/G-specific adenine glycosylase [Candidatus Pacebacteria bacterium]|nr:A/G-specific adenine glycosylase [Candidatus Paceibacterota bacterium]
MSAEKQFIQTVWNFYEANGRHDLPWRKTSNPYRILVSELMLQQTQVTRVIPKYKEFLKLFPTTKGLASAPLGEVLKAWQGLGYNRRAKFLWLTAKVVTNEYRGKWPSTIDGLKSLPGVGVYTAGAVMNFSYNKPVALIETNVRTVYIHHFFHDKQSVSDNDLLPFISRTLDAKNPREWNWALMDYGAYLKGVVGNVSVQSRSYKKQTPFKNSDRYVRGQILKLLATESQSIANIFKVLDGIEKVRVRHLLKKLLAEAMVVMEEGKYQLP